MSKKTKESSQVSIAKIGLIGIIIAAVIGLCGTIVAAIITTIGVINTEKVRQEAELTKTAYQFTTPEENPTQPPDGITSVTNLLLEYNGLYKTEDEKVTDSISSAHYLRFYPDGIVLGVSATGTPEEVAEWFNKSWGNFTGHYVIQGSTIKFTIKSLYGEVDYIGQIQEGGLVLESFSHINNNKSVNLYYFVEIPNIQP